MRLSQNKNANTLSLKESLFLNNGGGKSGYQGILSKSVRDVPTALRTVQHDKTKSDSYFETTYCILIKFHFTNS